MSAMPSGKADSPTSAAAVAEPPVMTQAFHELLVAEGVDTALIEFMRSKKSLLRHVLQTTVSPGARSATSSSMPAQKPGETDLRARS